MSTKNSAACLDNCKYPITIIQPHPKHVTELRNLWKEAFGDSDEFLDLFFSTAFAPERCLCILSENKIAAALYWFECEYEKHPLAYIYAVATAKVYRGQGFCQQLLKATHSLLKQQGYIGALLVPGSEALFDFYKKAGYQTTCCHHTYRFDLSTSKKENSATPQTASMVSLKAASNASIKELSALEYASLRKNFLPAKSILQEKENISFLQTQLKFYTGENFLAAVYILEETVHCPEFLYTNVFSTKNIQPDNPHVQIQMEQLLSYLNCTNGVFCLPGGTSPFAMYYPLNDSIQKAPQYFAFAYN